MKKRISVGRKGLGDLSPEDRMRAFQQDLRALNRLAKVVHKKAIEGDNAAGHLDLQIRHRKSQMFGYDSPQRYDMTLVAEAKRPSTREALLATLQRMCNEGELSAETQERLRAIDAREEERMRVLDARSLPEPNSEPRAVDEHEDADAAD